MKKQLIAMTVILFVRVSVYAGIFKTLCSSLDGKTIIGGLTIVGGNAYVTTSDGNYSTSEVNIVNITNGKKIPTIQISGTALGGASYDSMTGFLYGVTWGGKFGEGDVYRISTKEDNQFNEFAPFGFDPPCGQPSPAIGKENIYVSGRGPSYNDGTIYKLNKNMSTYSVLAQLPGSPRIKSNLIFHNDKLYVQIDSGLYEINSTDGAYKCIFPFEEFNTLGTYIIASNNTIYGVTNSGGEHGKGFIYKYDINSGKHSVIYNFDQKTNYWGNHDGLVMGQDGKTLYGTAEFGGVKDKGFLYRINTDGTGFEIIHNFNSEEGSPCALVLDKNALYGITKGQNENLFKYDLVNNI